MQPLHVDADIRQAKTLNSSFYNSTDLYEASLEKIFASCWQYAGHLVMPGGRGYVRPFTLLEGCLDEPLLLVTDENGTHRCLSNVCTHRANILVAGPGRLKSIRCGYHGRQFSLDGRFRSMPEFEGVKDFPCKDDDLKSLPLEVWGNLFFTALSPAAPFSEVFGDIRKRMAWFPMEALEYRDDLSKEYWVDAHWALYCENYLEGFHIPFVHDGLNRELDFGAYTTELFRYSNLQLGIGKAGDSCFNLPASAHDYGKQVAAYYFWVFPNMMFNFYPWGLSFNLVQPQGMNRTKVSFITYVLDASRLEQGAGSGLDEVEMEDEAIVEAVHRGVRSRFYRHGRYSPTREQGTHHFHRLIAEFMNR